MAPVNRGEKGQRMNIGQVSVIMPVYNAARFLAQALASVAAQTYAPVELLLIDGGSTDATEAIAQAHAAQHGPLRWLPQTGVGLAAAWNTGLAAAAGEFVAFLDSDDVWLPNKLDRQVAYLRAHPEAAFVIGQVEYFLEPGSPPPLTMKPEIFHGDYLARMPGALLARRSLFDAVGVYDPSYGISTDIEWFARVMALGVPSGTVPGVVIRKRVHADNLSSVGGPERITHHLPRLLKAALDQRRRREAQAAESPPA
jgi:glycosyltransferase involved in cell wall biosynthesis